MIWSLPSRWQSSRASWRRAAQAPFWREQHGSARRLPLNDGIFFNTENGGNDQYGGIKQLDDGSYEIQYVGMLGQINIQNATFFYAQKGDYQDIYKLAKTGDADGTYTAKAQLQKFGTNGSSMANAAMHEDVMITISEAGCVLGGVITFCDESYDADKDCYDLAVVPRPCWAAWITAPSTRASRPCTCASPTCSRRPATPTRT